jgi:hypothetical protein
MKMYIINLFNVYYVCLYHVYIMSIYVVYIMYLLCLFILSILCNTYYVSLWQKSMKSMIRPNHQIIDPTWKKTKKQNWTLEMVPETIHYI